MIFRRLCTPKKNNDAKHRLIFFGAQIHSESHGPIRRFLVDRVLTPRLSEFFRKGSCTFYDNEPPQLAVGGRVFPWAFKTLHPGDKHRGLALFGSKVRV